MPRCSALERGRRTPGRCDAGDAVYDGAGRRQRRRRLGRRDRARWPACAPIGMRAAAPLGASSSRRPPGSTAAPGRWSIARRRELVHQARRRPAARLAGQRRPGRAAGRAARGNGHRAGHRAHRAGDHAGDPPPDAHLGRPAHASSPTATWSAASTTRRPASSGSRRRAATASRPRPRWAKRAPRWRAACRCPATSPTSASARRCCRRRGFSARARSGR